LGGWGVAVGASLMALPDSRVNLLGQQFHLVYNGTDIPIAFARYRLIASTGETLEGVTDENGYTDRIVLESAATLDIEILHSERDLVIGDSDA
jgi:uncharacterized protein (DUF2345 family)